MEIPPVTGSEDFAYYLQKIPGTFYIVGSKPYDVEDFFEDSMQNLQSQ